MLKLMKRKMNAFLLAAAMMAGVATFAQTPELPPQQQQQQIEVSDAELNKFAQVYQGIQVANQEIQKEMMGVIEEEDLEVPTFNEIHMAKMENQEVDASPEDLEKYEEAVEKIEVLQVGFQERLEGLIVDEGLTVERYQEIATALQADQELQQRLQEILMG